MTPLLQLQNIHKRIDERVLLNDVSITIQPGSATLIQGNNGAGKSTLLNIMAGLERFSSGQVLYGGVKIHPREPAYKVTRRGLIKMYQQSQLADSLTVLENMKAASPYRPGSTFLNNVVARKKALREENRVQEEAREVLKNFGLSHIADQLAGELSVGQRRLVDFARLSAIARPRLMLLDEPYSGIHPTMIVVLRDRIDQLRSCGIGVVVVEHIAGITDQRFDSEYRLEQGRLTPIYQQ